MDRRWGWLILVAAGTFALYGPALSGGFVGDDFMILARLRPVESLPDLLRFFSGEFFGFYRPLGFISFALDWMLAGADARLFHLTSVLLHVGNVLLVYAIARALAPGSAAAGVAALLFATHAANHEAVFWISARFDLLATFCALAALWLVIHRGARHGERAAAGTPATIWMTALLFLTALLAKESVVALPIAIAAWVVFRQRASASATLLAIAPWLAALVLYALLRYALGGVPPGGGSGRLPKLLAFGASMAMLMAVAGRWTTARDWLGRHQRRVAIFFGVAVVGAALAAGLLENAIGAEVREKLAFAGFALFYLASPVVDVMTVPFFLDPPSTWYWLGGWLSIVAAGPLVWWLWRTRVDDDRLWFLIAALVACLIPVSALVEGTRYLYLPSAVVSLTVGVIAAGLRGRTQVVMLGLIAVVSVVSALEIMRKGRDWAWAGRMTSEAAHMVDAAVAPGCDDGRIVFLTSPVGVRGVYTHFYYETFALPRGCTPDVFQVLIRVLRQDTTVRVGWEGPRRIVLTVPVYAGNFVFSEDLRHFDRPMRTGQPAVLHTPLGEVRTEAAGTELRVVLTLPDDAHTGGRRFFYYSDGRIQALASP